MRAIPCWLSVWLVSFCGTAVLAELAPGTAKSVREILEVGFEPGRESLPKAKSINDAVVKSGVKSPEVSYAYGLVLLKQFKPKEAVEQFRLAVEHPDAPYWPAWQALIYTHFSSKETTAGYDRLFAFAKRVQSAPPEIAIEEQKRLVQWMGQLAGALDKLAESPKALEAVRKNEVRLRDLIAEPLQPSYDEGRHEASDAAMLVEAELDDAKQQQQSKNEQDRTEKQGKIAADAEAAKKKAEVVKKSADDWKRWLDDQLKQNDRLLARLEKDYGLLERRAQENLETQNQLDREINISRNQPQATGKQGPAARVNSRLLTGQTPQQRVDQLLNQKIQLQMDFDRTSQEGYAISQNAARVVQQRDLAMKKYQQMTGLLVKEEAATQKWQDRLKKDGEKLKAPASDKGGAVTRTLTKARSLRTYIDFDINDERQRLLDKIDPPKAAAN
ncbi:MAG: hypothetical protein IAG10_07620 [Planctomycetaceae bacterium]|nr:hypothetical protein [Planctomycetaceae bacterium]